MAQLMRCGPGRTDAVLLMLRTTPYTLTCSLVRKPVAPATATDRMAARAVQYAMTRVLATAGVATIVCMMTRPFLGPETRLGHPCVPMGVLRDTRDVHNGSTRSWRSDVDGLGVQPQLAVPVPSSPSIF